MSDFNFYPLAGMNTVDPDTNMVRNDRRNGRKVYARDLVNGRVDAGSTWGMRPGVTKVAATELNNLWYSERFNDTFATQGSMLVRLDEQWATTDLGVVGDKVSYIELNSTMIIAGAERMFEFNGTTLQPLSLADGYLPFVSSEINGGLTAGSYAIATSFRRGDKEGAVSEAYHVDVPNGGGINVVLTGAAGIDPTATHVTIYSTHANGGELYAVQTVPVSTTSVQLGADMKYGKLATTRFMTQMPTGTSVRFWRGRLVTVRSNTINFSEPLNYHIHDPVTGFIQLPTRITFIEPVDNGLWVGQKDDVIFLAGTSISELTVDYKNTPAPVPWSSTLINSELVSEKVSDSGMTTACWLAANGYVLGTSDGVCHEMSAGVLSGVSAARSQTVVHDRFLLTITQ